MNQSDLDAMTALIAERHDELCTAYDHALESHLAGGEPIPDAVRDDYIRSLVQRAIWMKLGGVMLDVERNNTNREREESLAVLRALNPNNPLLPENAKIDQP